jgi:hypothetical protein
MGGRQAVGLRANAGYADNVSPVLRQTALFLPLLLLH